MKPKISVLTLAVSNLENAVAFYRDGLGFPCKGILGEEFEGTETAPAGALGFFQLTNELILALYPRSELAKDANLPSAPESSLEFSIGYLADSKEDVDHIIDQAKSAGATLTDAPHERPWGIYSGYFKDPDGHLWEIIWNPSM